MAGDNSILEINGLSVAFGPTKVIDGLSFSVRKGEILGVIGPSGSGKSVTLRAIVGLLPKTGGTVSVFGHDYDALPPRERVRTERRWGVLFQQGALFSALTVLENIEFPMREHFSISPSMRREISRYKIDLFGLPPDAAGRQFLRSDVRDVKEVRRIIEQLLLSLRHGHLLAQHDHPVRVLAVCRRVLEFRDELLFQLLVRVLVVEIPVVVAVRDRVRGRGARLSDPCARGGRRPGGMRRPGDAPLHPGRRPARAARGYRPQDGARLRTGHKP
jgi:hypothetical protein